MTYSTAINRSCVALLALLSAACASPVNDGGDVYSVPDKFPITVEPHMETLRVPLNGAGGAIDETANAQLQRFARDYVGNGSGSIGIAAPRRFPNASTQVADRLISMGIPKGRISIGSESAVSLSDDVVISYVRYQAHAEACGNWNYNLGSTAENKPSPNLGCATQHNLAAMIANPRDLIAIQPLDPADVQKSLSVLDKYRKGEATVSTKTQDQNGAVSGVGGGGGGGGK